jgi:N-methylhydantoinase A/oxoprolinase/acetone carboxylase beta subunit
VDVGGTFTDVLLLNEQNGEIHTANTPIEESLGVEETLAV